MNSPDVTQSGATAVITHRIREGEQASYEHWLSEIGETCRAFPGHLDVQIIRPITGLTTTYTIVIRFDSSDRLRQWLESEERRQLIERARLFLADHDIYAIRSGLDFWFTPESTPVKVPVRWKQFLITWSAIYPLVLVVPLFVVPALRRIGVPDDRYIITLVVSAIMVFLMVYVVMPRYTKLVRHWLFD